MDNTEKIPLIVGSESPIKLGAAITALFELQTEQPENLLFKKITVEGEDTETGMNAQPEGLSEIREGAYLRAEQVSVENPKAIALGIENGVCTIVAGFTVDLAGIAIIDPELEEEEICMFSDSVPFPEDCVKIARERGFETTTVGSVIAEKTGCDGKDPHSHITRGHRSRTDILVTTIKMALNQWAIYKMK